MSTDTIEVVGYLPTSPAQIFNAWLDPAQHTAMTGGEATGDPEVGGSFTAWDGYITGTYLDLEPDRRILMAWRTSEFPHDAEDSRLELVLSPTAEGTRVAFLHDNIPLGQGVRYEQGWVDHYLTPMRAWASAAAG